MTKALRQKHFQIWLALSLLLPVGIISAFMVIPQKKIDRLLQPSTQQALPVLIKSIDKENYTASLRMSSDSSQLQLEWKNKTASVYPSSLIYQLAAGSNDINNAAIIGRVEARGKYYFSLKKDTAAKPGFVLYDFINKKLIDSLGF